MAEFTVAEIKRQAEVLQKKLDFEFTNGGDALVDTLERLADNISEEDASLKRQIEEYRNNFMNLKKEVYIKFKTLSQTMLSYCEKSTSNVEDVIKNVSSEAQAVEEVNQVVQSVDATTINFN